MTQEKGRERVGEEKKNLKTGFYQNISRAPAGAD